MQFEPPNEKKITGVERTCVHVTPPSVDRWSDEAVTAQKSVPFVANPKIPSGNTYDGENVSPLTLRNSIPVLESAINRTELVPVVARMEPEHAKGVQSNALVEII